MFRLIGMTLSGILHPDHWVQLGRSIGTLFSNPRGFYASVGDPDADRRVMTGGATILLVLTLIVAIGFGLLFGSLFGTLRSSAIPLCIGTAFLAWTLSILYSYTLGTWLQSLAVRLVIGPFDPARVRIVVFSGYFYGLVGILPALGNLLYFALFVVMTVIAYEKIYQVSRSRALAASLLSLLMTGFPFLLAAWMILALSFGNMNLRPALFSWKDRAMGTLRNSSAPGGPILKVVGSELEGGENPPTPESVREKVVDEMPEPEWTMTPSLRVVKTTPTPTITPTTTWTRTAIVVKKAIPVMPVRKLPFTPTPVPRPRVLTPTLEIVLSPVPTDTPKPLLQIYRVPKRAK